MTRVGPLLTSEKVRTPGTLATVQVTSASVERYRPPGRVPAIISDEFSGSCAIAQTSCMGLGIGSQRAVDSHQRNRPMSEPAHSTSASVSPPPLRLRPMVRRFGGVPACGRRTVERRACDASPNSHAGRRGPHCIECSPTMFPSVSAMSAMCPCGPMANFGRMTWPPAALTRAASIAQSSQAK